MIKIILIIGVIDGIGLEIVKCFYFEGYILLLYGRNLEKFVIIEKVLVNVRGMGLIYIYRGDLL